MKPLVVVGGFAFVATAGFVVWMHANSGETVKAKVAVTSGPGGESSAVAKPEAAPSATSELVSGVRDGSRSAEPSSAVASRTLVLGEGSGGFKLNALELSPEALEKLDAFFYGLGEYDLTTAHFAIEGHTDNLGSSDVNERIGLARAIAVKMYLGANFEVEPRQISVVSYGADRPVADNGTQEGRALNRRVVVTVTWN